jgi:DNA-binding ferritin-like protein
MTTTSSIDEKRDEKITAARRLEQMAADLSEIVTQIRSGGDDCEDLMDDARAARDHLDNLAIELRKRARRAQFVSSMTT